MKCLTLQVCSPSALSHPCAVAHLSNLSKYESISALPSDNARSFQIGFLAVIFSLGAGTGLAKCCASILSISLVCCRSCNSICSSCSCLSRSRISSASSFSRSAFLILWLQRARESRLPNFVCLSGWDTKVDIKIQLKFIFLKPQPHKMLKYVPEHLFKTSKPIKC